MPAQRDNSKPWAPGRPALALVLLMAMAALASAQPSMTVSVGRTVRSLDAVDQAGSRQANDGSVDLEQTVAAGRVRLFYSLDSGDYTTDGDWVYYLHTFGSTWRSNAAADATRTLFAGADVAWRANGASWAAADYKGLGVFVNAEYRPRAGTTLRTGYRLDTRRFPDLRALDQQEHSAFVSALVNLPSRTTFIAEVRVGAKSYNTSALSTTSTASAAGGMGTSGSYGRAMGPGLRLSQAGSSSGVVTSSVVFANERAGQLTVLGRVAQSLTDRTGVSLQYSRRTSFGDTPSVVVTTPALFFDDGIYDDPYASRADGVRATLKRALAHGAEIEGFASWSKKDYRGTLALDALGAAAGGLRADTITRAGASVSWPLFAEWTGQLGIALNGNYAFTRHRSNDAYYNYTSHGVGLGVTVSY
jgi:hypothetical protein